MKTLIIKGKQGTGKGYIAGKVASMFGSHVLSVRTLTDISLDRVRGFDAVVVDNCNLMKESNLSLIKQLITQVALVLCTEFVPSFLAKSHRFEVLDIDKFLSMIKLRGKEANTIIMDDGVA